ncbi:unnamed protein product [Cylicocyclus nassatus]|uniref:DUF456 domain-containing protein n=1 Tax=Cylicocyclus nassatus TaxID=53992 RepID=A0AA36DPU2_CYLNA|nr:unnamed protein product [Cylicocyclus nassatus]
MNTFKVLLVLVFLTFTNVHSQLFPPPYDPYMINPMMGGGLGMGGIDPLTGALIGSLVGGVVGLLTGA